MTNLRVLGTVFVLHLKQMAVDSWVIFTVIVQPLIVALLAIYMLRETEGFQAIYVIVGSAMTGLWSGTIYISSRGIDTERWSGTLEQIVGSPTSVALVITGKALANVTLSLCSMLFSYPIAALFFGFRLSVAEPLLFLVSLALTVVAFISMALVIAPIFSMNPGSFIWANALEFPVYILGGFLFPILLLPAWTTPISYALSPYWAARALHAMSSGGAPIAEVFVSWSWLIAACIVYWIVSAWLFRVLLRRARVQATLGVQ
jgi:ABC-2 type transport system permease protein